MNAHPPTFRHRSPGVRAVPGWVLAAAAAAGFASHPLAGAANVSTLSPDSPTSGPDAMTGMAGLYGPYDLTREGSGTSWQPDSTPMRGLHGMSGAWMGMVHGFIDLIYDDQGGARGATETFSTSMLMLVARRELTDGALGLRFMVSGDPAKGKQGYPLLFQTGETADRHPPLID